MVYSTFDHSDVTQGRIQSWSMTGGKERPKNSLNVNAVSRAKGYYCVNY